MSWHARNPFSRESLESTAQTGDCRWCGSGAPILRLVPDSIADRSSEIGAFCDIGCLSAHSAVDHVGEGWESWND